MDTTGLIAWHNLLNAALFSGLGLLIFVVGFVLGIAMIISAAVRG